MTQKDVINLFKLLEGTNSASSAEVLEVLKRVNNMLRNAGKSWQDLYELCRTAPESEAPPEVSDKPNGWETEIIDLPNPMLLKNVQERFKQSGLTQFEKQANSNIKSKNR